MSDANLAEYIGRLRADQRESSCIIILSDSGFAKRYESDDVEDAVFAILKAGDLSVSVPS